MGIFDFLKGNKTVESTSDLQVVEAPPVDEAPPVVGPSSSFVRSFAVDYNGEKSFGDLGPAITYKPNYHLLAVRSWQSLIENPVSKTIIEKYSSWIIDKGLDLQSRPNRLILEQAGINIDTQQFARNIEARFKMWGKSKFSSVSGMKTFAKTTKDAFLTSIVSGDDLIVLRVENKVLRVQIIDGQKIADPIDRSEMDEGNKIINGVEVDANGGHVAYYIRKDNFKHQRIKAIEPKTGFRMAFLFRVSEYSLTETRGLPILSTNLETLKVLDRYRDATLTGAEERAKVPYFIKHDINSTGESPLDEVRSIFNSGASGNGEWPTDDAGNNLARALSISMDKTVHNLTQGSELKSLDSKNETSFEGFWTPNTQIVCSALNIPPNVAFSIYNDSFSASRAATKDWEHTIDVKRAELVDEYFQNIYNIFLHLEIMRGNIDAPGYMEAFLKNDIFVLEAYRSAQFVGAKFPHIDPLKEVNAERAKLGPLGQDLPLTTHEAATMMLMSGESDSNAQQFAEEVRKFNEWKTKNGIDDGQSSGNPTSND